MSGPFGAGLAAEPDNLILRALRALGQATGAGEPPLKVTLDKRLPIAAGLGGGSSDAGAALKLARQALALDIDDAALEAVAGVIGADGPMCLRMRTAWAEGRGEVLTDEPHEVVVAGLDDRRVVGAHRRSTPSCSIRASLRPPAPSTGPMTPVRRAPLPTPLPGPRRPPTGARRS